MQSVRFKIALGKLDQRLASKGNEDGRAANYLNEQALQCKGFWRVEPRKQGDSEHPNDLRKCVSRGLPKNVSPV